MFTIFFLFLYFVCEVFKYRRIDTIKVQSSIRGRLYNERIVFIKMFVIGIDFILFIIIFFTSKIEKSSGIKGLLISFIPYAIFILISVRDIKKVINGHNEKILGGAKDKDITEDIL